MGPNQTSLGDAISGVESAAAGLGTADTNQQAAQMRYDSAAVAKGSADSADVDAVGVFNTSLDVLITAATAAHVVREVKVG